MRKNSFATNKKELVTKSKKVYTLQKKLGERKKKVLSLKCTLSIEKQASCTVLQDEVTMQIKLNKESLKRVNMMLLSLI